jgi:hypothetical protein
LVTAPTEGYLFLLNTTSEQMHTPNEFDYPLLYLLVSILAPIFGCFLLVLIFLWYFRRKPDAIEVLVLQSNVQIGKIRLRKPKGVHMSKSKEQEANKVYAEHYEM